jgi:riboflavin biosynthesis pyrimidine reductase
MRRCGLEGVSPSRLAVMRQLLPEPARQLLDRVALEEAYATPANPSLRANFVVSLDGAIEVNGQSAPLSGPADMELFATLRALTDAVVVGASTARLEHYGPAKVAPEAVERRSARGQAPIPTIAVVTATAGLDPDGLLFSREPRRGIVPPRPLILTCETAPVDRRKRLTAVADLVLCGVETVDMTLALAELRARGLNQVLCEGGPSLFTTLVSEGHVDELCLTHSLLLAGPGNHSLVVAAKRFGEGDVWDELIRWRLSFLAQDDGLLLARYQFERAEKVGDQGP